MRTLSGWVTSQSISMPSPPFPRINECDQGGVGAEIDDATCAPFRADHRAVAWPVPTPAPVKTTIESVNGVSHGIYAPPLTLIICPVM